MANIIRTDQLDRQRLSGNAREWTYNGLDCCVTLEILEEIRPLLDNLSAATYDFSKSLQAPVLEMTLRGLRVDMRRRAQVLRELHSDIDRLAANLDTIIRDGIGTAISWRSPKQLMELLYNVLGLPPVKKRNANGSMAPTVNRDALEQLSANYFLAEPICNHLLALRDLDKQRMFLESQIDNDGRIRTSMNIGGTNTGRLSCAISDFGTGANLQTVDSRLRSVFIADDGYELANFDLAQADARNVGAICWNLFLESHGPQWAGAYLDACESGDLHSAVSRMVWPAADPKEIYYRQDSRRQVCKKLGHGCLTGEHEVLTRNGWVRIDTMPSEILQWSRFSSSFEPVSFWTEQNYTGELQHFIGNSIDAIMTHDHRVPYFKDQKAIAPPIHVKPAEAGPGTFMPLGNDYEGGTEVVPARIIAAVMADGSKDKYGISFHFAKDRKAERITRLCNEAGIKIKRYDNADGTYKLYIKADLPKYPGAFMLAWSKDCLLDFLDELKYWDGYVGETSVTIYSTDHVALEWYQTLGRILGFGGSIGKPYTSGFGSTVYRLQQNHRRCASGSSVKHTKIAVEGVKVYCPKVPSSFFYVRHNGKIFVTGNTNYYGTPPTMAKHTHADVPIIESFQRSYFAAFPAIGVFDKKDHRTECWHNSVRQALLDSQQITTLLGRRRYFFGRPDDAETIRAAIAFEPQSCTADEINTGMLRLWRANIVQLMLQVHDSLLMQYPIAERDTFLPQVAELLRVQIELKGGRRFEVPVDGKIGRNWGDRSEANPEGLHKWAG